MADHLLPEAHPFVHYIVRGINHMKNGNVSDLWRHGHDVDGGYHQPVRAVGDDSLSNTPQFGGGSSGFRVL